MNEERMELAIATLEGVIAHQKPFDMDVWYEEGDDYDDPIDPMDCGTAACALGWISRQKWAQDAGMLANTCGGGITPHIVIKDFYLEGYDAGAALLDITFDESVWLFGWDQYGVGKTVTAEDVLKRMQKLLSFYRGAVEPDVLVARGGWAPEFAEFVKAMLDNPQPTIALEEEEEVGFGPLEIPA